MRISDWSSDVCSSDLLVIEEVVARRHHRAAVDRHQPAEGFGLPDLDLLVRRLFFVHLFAFQRKRGAGAFHRFGEPAAIQRHDNLIKCGESRESASPKRSRKRCETLQSRLAPEDVSLGRRVYRVTTRNE